MPIRIKRIYEAPAAGDGHRVLVDGVWPRGVSRERAAVHEWLREIAPSAELRRWFGHRPERWPEFRDRYRSELGGKPHLLSSLKRRGDRETLTLVFAARDLERNNALVLRELLEEEPDDGSTA